MHPKTSMKRTIKPISIRVGLSTIPGSTLSVEIVISGRSVSKFVSRICLGSRGRKCKNSDAPAMLNILPKLALVAIKIYLRVLTVRFGLLRRLGRGVFFIFRFSTPPTLPGFPVKHGNPKDFHGKIQRYLVNHGNFLNRVFKRFDGTKLFITAPDCSGNLFLFFLLK